MNLFSSERNQNWLIWIWCIKFHLFLWKLSDVFIAINRFANKFNIYISILFNYVFNFIYQMFCWRCSSTQLFYLSPVPLLIFGVTASHRKEAHFLTEAWFCAWFSHGGLILCSGLIQKFLHFFLTITWVVASFVCNKDDIIDKVYYFLEFLIPSKLT